MVGFSDFSASLGLGLVVSVEIAKQISQKAD
jgi:hypothetical protein